MISIAVSLDKLPLVFLDKNSDLLRIVHAGMGFDSAIAISYASAGGNRSPKC